MSEWRLRFIVNAASQGCFSLHSSHKVSLVILLDCINLLVEFEVAWKTHESNSLTTSQKIGIRELEVIAKQNVITQLSFKHDCPDELPPDVLRGLVGLRIPYKPG